MISVIRISLILSANILVGSLHTNQPLACVFVFKCGLNGMDWYYIGYAGPAEMSRGVNNDLILSFEMVYTFNFNLI